MRISRRATVSAAAGGAALRPLTILWSVSNKGGLAAPPDNYDQGTVTGSGGFYASAHGSIDTSGTDSGSNVAEDYIFLSGDQTSEAMDIYPSVMTHEMGHFAQTLFSTAQSPGGDHSYNDYQDPTLAWIEGSASGIAALVMNTPTQDRLAYVSGEIVVGIYDISNNTISGNPQSWPIGWYQESTITAMMWAVLRSTGRHAPVGGRHPCAHVFQFVGSGAVPQYDLALRLSVEADQPGRCRGHRCVERRTQHRVCG